MRSLVAVAVLAGFRGLASCGGSQGDAPPVPAVVAPAPKVATPTAARRWIPGDLHQHVAPFDAREGAAFEVAGLAQHGPAAGLEFVIATPHLYLSTVGSPERLRAWMAQWTLFAAQARAVRGFTVIPGVEYTASGFGHFGVSGVEVTRLDVDDLLATAHAAGGFVVVNHPFAVPTSIPGIPVSDRDLSFRPWSEGVGKVPAVDAVEVWNLPLGLANLASRPGGHTGEERAFVAADALARAEHRRIAVVGGSDSHGPFIVATTWVFATDASEPAILAALHAGATCVGGPEAGTLTARGDADPPERWAAIGEIAHARTTVELRWTGTGHLFVDGLDRGEHDGAWTHASAAGAHTYRLERDHSRCGFVYANLDDGP